MDGISVDARSNAASSIYVTNFAELWIGMRLRLTIRVLQERYADYGQISFIAVMRADIQIAHPVAATGSWA